MLLTQCIGQTKILGFCRGHRWQSFPRLLVRPILHTSTPVIGVFGASVLRASTCCPGTHYKKSAHMVKMRTTLTLLMMMTKAAAYVCTTLTFSACQGLYDAAFDILKSASERFPTNCHHSSIWMAAEQQIRFTASLHRERLNVAEQAINNLASVAMLEAAYWSAYVLLIIILSSVFIY